MNPQFPKRRVVSAFLSSTGPDLQQYRDHVYEALNRMPDCKCIRMEDFPASPFSVSDYCRSEVQQSDIFVGLIGFRFGSPVDPDDPKSLSYTQLEYLSAKAANLPILMHMAPKDFSASVSTREPDKLYERQLQFRADIPEMSCAPVAWSSPETLANFAQIAVQRAILGLGV